VTRSLRSVIRRYNAATGVDQDDQGHDTTRRAPHRPARVPRSMVSLPVDTCPLLRGFPAGIRD